MKFIIIALSLCLTMACAETSNQSEMPATVDNSSEDTQNVVEDNKQRLRHVVLFKYKDSATDADIKKIEEAFAALPAKIPQIKDFEWGTNNSPEALDKGFTHCFFLTFDSEEDRAIYLPHPDHKAFGAILTPYLEDVLVLDYWVN